MTIRQETDRDHPAVFDLITIAFAGEPLSDHREQYLVERLRRSHAFVPELALVAELDGEVVGYILLTEARIEDARRSFTTLALAPVAVRPDRQGRGIGGRLIDAAHDRARQLGYTSVVLLGHADYYPRFGYRRCDGYGIELPFEAPPENCLAVELVSDGLAGVRGTVRYPEAFAG